MVRTLQPHAGSPRERAVAPDVGADDWAILRAPSDETGGVDGLVDRLRAGWARPGGRLVGVHRSQSAGRPAAAGSGPRAGDDAAPRERQRPRHQRAAAAPRSVPPAAHQHADPGREDARRWPERRARQRRARRPRWGSSAGFDGRSHHRRRVGGGWIRQPRGRVWAGSRADPTPARVAERRVRERRWSLADADACPCPFGDSRQRSPHAGTADAADMDSTAAAYPRSNGSSRRNR
jgi:hypothetical protein